MARITGEPAVTGKVGPVSIYYTKKWGYLLRKNSSLTGDRVKTDPAFKQTMRYADLMSQASGIGSRIYKQLPEAQRKHPLYRKITGEAMRLIREGRTKEEVMNELEVRWLK